MTLKTALLLIISGVLANNFVFEKFFASEALLGISRKENKLAAMGLGVFFVILLSSPLTWAVYTYILAPADLAFLKLLVFVALILCVTAIVSALAKALCKKELGCYFPILAVNSAVLALCISTVTDGLGFVEAQLTAVGVAFGFLFAMAVFAGLREKIEDTFIPKAFRGLPIELLAAAIVSMALLAFK